MKAFFQSLKSDVLGGTAVEYGLILALMFIAMAGALEGFSSVNQNTWTKVSDAMSNVVANGAAS